MTDTTPETPATEPLVVEMRKGDKFVNVHIAESEEANLADPSYQLFLMKNLVKEMVGHKAIKVPLSDAELRRLATRKAYDLVKTAELFDHAYLASELGISVEEAVKVADLAAAATVVIN